MVLQITYSIIIPQHQCVLQVIQPVSGNMIKRTPCATHRIQFPSTTQLQTPASAEQITEIISTVMQPHGASNIVLNSAKAHNPPSQFLCLQVAAPAALQPGESRPRSPLLTLAPQPKTIQTLPDIITCYKCDGTSSSSIPRMRLHPPQQLSCWCLGCDLHPATEVLP